MDCAAVTGVDETEAGFSLRKLGFDRNGFLDSGEGDFRTCTHVMFLSLALLGVSVLCFWAFYAVVDIAFEARPFDNKRRGGDVVTVPPQDAVGVAMRKILLDERPLRKIRIASVSRRVSTPRYFDAAGEKNVSNEELPQDAPLS